MDNNIIFIEEHNEAFKEIYNFYKAKREKFTLLHIDEHDDMRIAYVKKEEIDSMDEMSINHIVYEQLNVGSYIVPLIYKSILDNVIWLSNDTKESYCELKIIETIKNNGFISIDCKKVKPNGENIGYLKVNSSSDIRFMKNRKMITSIDLDYFGTNDSRGEEIVIEISENEYFNLMNNKYHKVRLELGSMAYPYQKNGKYYLKIYGRIENQNEKVDIHIIETKIQRLKDFFIRNNISPELIIVCKSFKSGYTDDIVKKYIKQKYPKIQTT